VELVDTTDLKSVEHLIARAGSIPAPGTIFFLNTKTSVIYENLLSRFFSLQAMIRGLQV
jgi:hypothetical protein